MFSASFPSKTGLVSIRKDRGLPAVVVALRVRTSFPCIAAGDSAFGRVPRVAPWSLPQARSPLHLHTHLTETSGSCPFALLAL